jgi:hypothetical protein
MYKIILKDQSYTREYGTDNAIDALVLFDTLTKTYLHVEMWQGATSSNNTRTAKGTHHVR